MSATRHPTHRQRASRLGRHLSVASLIVIAAAWSVLAGAEHTARLVGEFGCPYGHLAYHPDAYLADPDAARPLLVFLHGDGERGPGEDVNDIWKGLTVHGPHKEIEINGNEIFNDYGVLVISPQFPGTPILVEQAKAFIDWVRSQYNVDPSRIYLTGLSNGASVVWTYPRTYPQDLAAMIPIAGGETPSSPERMIDLSIWAFHNANDPRFPIESSTAPWLDAIATATSGQDSDVMAGYTVPTEGSTPIQSATFTGVEWTWRSKLVGPPAGARGLTVYPQSGHDSWSVTFSNDTTWMWLFNQRRPIRERRVNIVIDDSAAGVGRMYQNGEQVDEAAGTSVISLIAPTSTADAVAEVEETMTPIPE